MAETIQTYVKSNYGAKLEKPNIKIEPITMKIDTNMRTNTPKDVKVETENVEEVSINLEEYINDKDTLKKELEKLGINYESVVDVKVLDDENIEISYKNGVVCKYRVESDGSLTILSGVGYDSEGNIVYKGEIDSETNEGVSIYYDGKTGIIVREIFSDENGRTTKEVICNSEGKIQSTTEYIYLKNDTYKKITTTDKNVTSVTYNEKDIPIYANVKSDEGTINYSFFEDGSVSNAKAYDSSGTRTYSYNLDENGKVKTFRKYDKNGNMEFRLSNDNTYKVSGENIYFIDTNGALVKVSSSNLESSVSDSNLKYILTDTNGKNVFTLFNSDGTITYMNEKQAKENKIIDSGYDFSERTTLSYDGYYYPSSPNGINSTNDVGSCVWYVVGRINEVYDEVGINKNWSYHGYSSDWVNQLSSSYNTSTDVYSPKAGAVAVWNGHVGYIESVNSNGTVNFSEGNINAKGPSGFVYHENVSLSSLKNLYGHNFLGYVYTLPDE